MRGRARATRTQRRRAQLAPRVPASARAGDGRVVERPGQGRGRRGVEGRIEGAVPGGWQGGVRALGCALARGAPASRVGRAPPSWLVAVGGGRGGSVRQWRGGAPQAAGCPREGRAWAGQTGEA